VRSGAFAGAELLAVDFNGESLSPEFATRRCKMTSWKTTVGGLILALGATCTQMDDSTYKLIGGVLSAIGALILGIAAKDSNVTGGTKEQ
jgi:hypothetical protein